MKVSKKLKTQLHRRQQQNYLDKCKMHNLNNADKVMNEKARTSEATPFVGLILPYKQAMKGNPKDLQRVRKLVIEKILGTKFTEQSSRLTLWDYRGKDIIVEGYIADVKPDSHILLLDHPYISYDNQGNSMNQLIDSHAWINLDCLQKVGRGIVVHQEVAIGDRIIFTANVDEYKGRTRTGYGYRFGLKPKKLWACGIPYRVKDGGYGIISHYPRLGDWVLRFKYLPGRSTHPMEIEYRDSNYPSYVTRMHLHESSEIEQND